MLVGDPPKSQYNHPYARLAPPILHEMSYHQSDLTIQRLFDTVDVVSPESVCSDIATN